MEDRVYKFFQAAESGTLSVIQFRLAITAPTTIVHEVQKEITDFVAINHCRKLVIDLASTAYMPSSVIGILAVLSTRGVEVHLANASRDVTKVMEVTGLSKRIHINEYKVIPQAETSRGSVPVSVVNGYIVSCPECNSRQRVERELMGSTGKCKNCHSPIQVDSELLQSATHVSCTCPACDRDLQLSADVVSTTAKCEYCDGRFRVRKVQ